MSFHTCCGVISCISCTQLYWALTVSGWKLWFTGCVCVLLPSARDADEREKWIHALEGTILRHTLQLRVCNHICICVYKCVYSGTCICVFRTFITLTRRSCFAVGPSCQHLTCWFHHLLSIFLSKLVILQNGCRVNSDRLSVSKGRISWKI